MDNKKIANLVRLAKNNDKDAIAELYQAVYSSMHYTAYHMLQNKENAEDIVQDSFVTCISKINQLQDDEAFVAYICRITSNKSLDFLRKSHREVADIAVTDGGEEVVMEIEDLSQNADIEQTVIDSEKQRMIIEIIDRLPELQRATIMMFYYEDFSISDIAKMMECSDNTVKSRLNYARKYIKSEVEKLRSKYGDDMLIIIPQLGNIIKASVPDTAPQNINAVTDRIIHECAPKNAVVKEGVHNIPQKEILKEMSKEKILRMGAIQGMKTIGKLTATQTIAALVSAGVIIIGGATIAGAVYYNSYDLTNNKFESELGNSLNTNTGIYVKAGNNEAVQKTTLDFSEVDVNSVGNYMAKATYKDKTLEFTVEVIDTTPPEINLKSNFENAVIGQPVNIADYTENISDLGNVQNIQVLENDQVLTEGRSLDDMSFTFSTGGTHELVIRAKDWSNNVSEKTFSIKSIKDYKSMVSGFHDFSVQEGSDIDYMESLSYPDGELTVDVDNSGVDKSTPGDYTVTFNMTGDDGETKFSQEQSVTITAKPKPAPEPVKSPSTSSSSSKGSSSSGSNYSSSSGGSSSGSSSPSSSSDSDSGSSSSTPSTSKSSSSADSSPIQVGESVGDYKARTGKGISGGTPGGKLFQYPSSYVWGSNTPLYADSAGKWFYPESRQWVD